MTNLPAGIPGTLVVSVGAPAPHAVPVQATPPAPNTVPTQNVPQQNNFGDTQSDGLAGPMGLLIIVLLGIATVLLIRSMNKRLRKLPDRFPGPAKVEVGSRATDPTGAAGAETPPGPAAASR